MQDNVQELNLAVTQGQLEKVIALLISGADPNTINFEGYPVIHMAAQFGHLNIIEALLNAGAELEKLDKHKRTALHIASYNGREEIILKLIAAGANVNSQCVFGWTPLHAVVMQNHCRSAEILIQFQAGINIKDHVDYTPLHIACLLGHQRMAALLYQSGADVSLQESSQYLTPIHIASQHGHIEIMIVFSEGGVDMNLINAIQETPLHIACRYNQIDSVKLLIDLKVNINHKSPVTGTPLWVSSRANHDSIAKLLLATGAIIDPSDFHSQMLRIEMSRPQEVVSPWMRDYMIFENSRPVGQGSSRFFRAQGIDWNKEKLPENFKIQYSEMIIQWDEFSDMSLKNNCMHMLLDYIQGWGWRHHRGLCQTIYNDLVKVEDTAEQIYRFFQNQLKQYHFDINYRQEGLFVRTLLFCKYAIVNEQRHPQRSISQFNKDFFCNIM